MEIIFTEHYFLCKKGRYHYRYLLIFSKRGSINKQILKLMKIIPLGGDKE